MLKNHPLLSYLRYSIVAAILYSIAGAIFLYQQSFLNSYLLYIGNVMFAAVIVVFIFIYNSKRKDNANAIRMIAAGHITAAMGLVISCIICVGLFLFFAHGTHQTSVAVLENSPPQMDTGRHHELLFAILFNAVIGNISASSFISIVLPYAVKRKQASEVAK